MTDDHAVVLAGRRVPMLDKARMYVCGITPYDVTHLGHAATFVWVDALDRVLRLLGVEPEVCRNVTDVDDVLDAAAGRAGAHVRRVRGDPAVPASSGTWPRLSDRWPAAGRPAGAPVRGSRSSGWPRGLTGGRRGRTSAQGGVYFGGAGAAAQAGLGRAEDAGTGPVRGVRRAGRTTRRRTTRWTRRCGRPPSAVHPAWESPWGPGRPGWHAECAAMAPVRVRRGRGRARGR